MDKAALETLVTEALAAFERASSSAELEQEKARYLGKSGALTAQLKGLGKLSPEERPRAGAWINEAKLRIEDALSARRAALIAGRRRCAPRQRSAGRHAARPQARAWRDPSDRPYLADG